jgi:hypothetical protein
LNDQYKHSDKMGANVIQPLSHPIEEGAPKNNPPDESNEDRPRTPDSYLGLLVAAFEEPIASIATSLAYNLPSDMTPLSLPVHSQPEQSPRPVGNIHPNTDYEYQRFATFSSLFGSMAADIRLIREGNEISTPTEKKAPPPNFLDVQQGKSFQALYIRSRPDLEVPHTNPALRDQMLRPDGHAAAPLEDRSFEQLPFMVRGNESLTRNADLQRFQADKDDIKNFYPEFPSRSKALTSRYREVIRGSRVQRISRSIILTVAAMTKNLNTFASIEDSIELSIRRFEKNERDFWGSVMLGNNIIHEVCDYQDFKGQKLIII